MSGIIGEPQADGLVLAQAAGSLGDVRSGSFGKRPRLAAFRAERLRLSGKHFIPEAAPPYLCQAI
jgi:hypothetical protein